MAEGINVYKDSYIVSWSYDANGTYLVIIGKARKTGGIDILCSFAGDDAKHLIDVLTGTIIEKRKEGK